MRKIILLVILFGTCLAAYAGGSWEEAEWVEANIFQHKNFISDYESKQTYFFLTPYYGSRGSLNMVDSKYHNENYYDEEGNLVRIDWSDTTDGTPGWNQYTHALAGAYTNAEMVALGGIYNLKPYEGESNPANMDDPITISISCPNGFYLVSQSNPEYKRPFRLVLNQTSAAGGVVSKPKYYESGYYYEGDKVPEDIPPIGPKHGRGDQKVFREPLEDKLYFDYKAAQSANADLADYSLEEIIVGKKLSTNGGGPEQIRVYCGFWFDLVLDLPGEYDPLTESITYQSIKYPLIEADDYSALVTITISYPDEPIKTVTIPFSGYYRRSEVNVDATASLVVDAYPAAAHLSIEQDRGLWVPVGKLDFMSFSGSPGDDIPQNTWSNPVIFISSSSTPSSNTGGEFKLVHSNVRYDTPLTQANSIGFSVRVRALNSGTGTPVAIFEGGDCMDTIASGKTEGILVNKTESIEEADGGDRMGHMFSSLSYYSYSGEIDVMLDSGTNIMNEGVYRGTMYIHVIGDKGA